MTRRFAARFAPLIVLAVISPTATAGPMSWTYKAVIEAGVGGDAPPGAAMISLGRFPVTAPAGDSVTATPFAWAPLPTGGSGAMDGSGTITLAAASKGSYTTGETPPTGPPADGFRTLLEITDIESGARGYTYMNGTGSLVGGPADASEVQLSGEGRVQIDLGRHRYDITWHRDESESVSRIVADVNMTGGVNTPEPATLALAGLGLGMIGVRRLRRRHGS